MFWGVAIFVLGVAAVLSGVVAKSIFALGRGYALLPAEALVVNAFGAVVVVFALGVGGVVFKPEWRRVEMAGAVMGTVNNDDDDVEKEEYEEEQEITTPSVTRRRHSQNDTVRCKAVRCGAVRCGMV